MKFTRKVDTYRRAANGDSWESEPTTTMAETVDEQSYINCVNSIPFFDGLFGGKCWAEYGDTKYGYTPIKIILINPSQDEKQIETWRITE